MLQIYYISYSTLNLPIFKVLRWSTHEKQIFLNENISIDREKVKIGLTGSELMLGIYVIRETDFVYFLSSILYKNTKQLMTEILPICIFITWFFCNVTTLSIPYWSLYRSKIASKIDTIPSSFISNCFILYVFHDVSVLHHSDFTDFLIFWP